jgi:hypothetical protein
VELLKGGYCLDSTEVAMKLIFDLQGKSEKPSKVLWRSRRSSVIWNYFERVSGLVRN